MIFFRIALIALAAWIASIPAIGQSLDTVAYAKRYGQIVEAAKKGEFSTARNLYIAQLKSLRQAGKSDSLYRFCYEFPKVIYQLAGVQGALDSANNLVNEVERKDPNMRHHLLAINDLSWLYYEFGIPEEALQTDLRYLAKVNDFGGREPRDVYVANFNVAADYQNLGNALVSIKYFEKSIEAVNHDTVLFANDLVNAYNGLGAAQFRNGEFVKGKKSLNKSLQSNLAIQDSTDRYLNEANIYGNLALIFEEEGNLVNAKANLEKSLLARRNGLARPLPNYLRLEQRNHLIRNYHNLSGLYLRIGDVNRSYKVQEFAQNLRNELLDKDHVDHLKTLESFGSIEMALGNFEKARSMFNQYLAFCLEKFGEASYYTCTAYYRIGLAEASLGNWEAASQSLTEAIQTGKRVTGESTGQELAKAYLDRSEAYRELGAFANAENDVRQYMRISKETRLATDPFLARGYNAIAEIKLAAGEPDSARYFCDRAIAIVKEHIDVNKGQSRRYDQFTFSLPESYLLQARIQLGTGQNEKNLLVAAQSLEAAMVGIQQQKRMLEVGASQIVLIDRLVDVYNLAQGVYFDLWKISGNEQYLNEMLLIAEQSKSTLLRGQLNRFTSLRVAQMPDSIASKENQLLLELSGQNNSEDENRDDFEVERDFDKLLREIAEKYPDYYRLRYQDFAAYPDTIRSVLVSEGVNILEYTITANRAFGFLINQNGMKVIEISSEGIEDMLARFGKAVLTRDEKSAQLGYELYRRLFKPFEPHFAGTDIRIIPHGPLFQINFEALVKRQNENRPYYLIEDYTLSYLLSATTALQFKVLTKPKSGGVLALAPGFSDELKQAYLTDHLDTVSFDDDYLQFIQQPFAVHTAEGLGSYFESRVLVGNQATEENFKAEAGKYAIIHLGTHTEINNISPLLSRLVLAKSGDTEGEDGYLHAYEIYNLSLRAELAVLTACETGLGKSSSSEGMLSLAHSFAYAGCPSILMSLWQIDEQSAASITEDFYAYLSKGQPKNEALRQAKLDYLHAQSGELSQPYYWSGMVLLGDVSPIPSSKTPMWLWLLIAAVVGLAAWFLIRRPRKRA